MVQCHQDETPPVDKSREGANARCESSDGVHFDGARNELRCMRAMHGGLGDCPTTGDRFGVHSIDSELPPDSSQDRGEANRLTGDNCVSDSVADGNANNGADGVCITLH
ncbi:hypothetical protein ECG_08087 [Echinococcus granulosus]|uniref:Uncharacterized protein n=1 Tax=Echinococcus granulosus TaxID=6210 RepID=A0A068X1R4_ECHGR|nr:hypothetical protein ECG_08087 [Echinococcus granulosus]CDS23823.1 hypothetical protein EgrG_002046800 [Echinococcus granulosus]